jgi:NAD(P)-dependent dehydrogenase (short-subunit alcohol dehydrogenase family)
VSDLSGRHVIVTGASTGIGRASAVLLGERGARVSLIARSADKLAALALPLRSPRPKPPSARPTVYSRMPDSAATSRRFRPFPMPIGTA